jgi:hypothetical protein
MGSPVGRFDHLFKLEEKIFQVIDFLPAQLLVCPGRCDNDLGKSYDQFSIHAIFSSEELPLSLNNRDSIYRVSSKINMHLM